MRRFARIGFAIFCLLALSVGSLTFYVSKPPQKGRLGALSSVLRASDGSILSLELTKDGYWREAVELSEIDPRLVEFLIAYEDQRFWEHNGVDFRAGARAVLNSLRFGRITSGASTITMQTARLLDTSLRDQSLGSKLKQALEALRLEAHWSKEEILEAYFALAPYGGNIEGVKAATEAWFQKTPSKLTLNEIALLVALPQSPERRRPDRFPEAAYIAKQSVLEKVAPRLNLSTSLIDGVLDEPLPARLSKPKARALHLMQRLAQHTHTGAVTSIYSDWQYQVEEILARDIETRPKPIQAAAMVVERKTGRVRAYVGSADYNSSARKGAINYLTAVRSPGSTLKPLIYAKALDRNLIKLDHVFDDTAYFRSGYRPTNFSPGFSGQVGLKDALLQSLNIPAIRAVEQVGPSLLQAELKTYLDGRLPPQPAAGLSLAVGGLYLTPEQLTAVYLGLVDPGTARQLSFTKNEQPATEMTLVSQPASEQILSLLIQEMSNGERVAFKTGTSFARQDAWSVQIFEDYLVLVWLGTPDNEPTDKLTGASAAYPISLAIGRSLDLKSPSTPDVRKYEKADELLATDTCPKLIEYPSDGAWIKSSSGVIALIGDQDADWYLNGAPNAVQSMQAVTNMPGVNKITARLGDCFESTEIFVEFSD